jgi:hypothetical protein
MRVRKILGSVEIGHLIHCIGRLENGHFAVGRLFIGQRVKIEAQFEVMDAAFANWLATMPKIEDDPLDKYRCPKAGSSATVTADSSRYKRLYGVASALSFSI